ncbi:ribbon-helix-helix protein, CopG family [Salinibacter ruber]|uniref:ribbon-helix-helix protein, CopG family n=1 Tax=Salinibacter ruber TaxID=146919 RepID=UPI00355B8C98
MDQDERLEIRLPSQLKERVVRQAEEEYTTQSEVVRRALLAYLEDNKHEPPKSDD